jgi:hypothetical protein
MTSILKLLLLSLAACVSEALQLLLPVLRLY